MNNSVCGKIMKNLRKRVKVKLVNNANIYEKYLIRASLVLRKIFSENFVAIHKTKPVLLLDKPIYARFSILDSSKLLMYELH